MLNDDPLFRYVDADNFGNYDNPIDDSVDDDASDGSVSSDSDPIPN